MTIEEMQIQFARWQEQVVTDLTASGEDEFIYNIMTNSDFIE